MTDLNVTQTPYAAVSYPTDFQTFVPQPVCSLWDLPQAGGLLWPEPATDGEAVEVPIGQTQRLQSRTWSAAAVMQDEGTEVHLRDKRLTAEAAESTALERH